MMTEEQKQDMMRTEYSCLRSEQLERIKLMYTQNISTLGVVVTIFSIGLVLFANVFGKIENLVESENKTYVAIILIQIVLFGLPAIILFHSSYKSRENIMQIANLGAYFLVFYELKYYVDFGDRVISWESFQNKISTKNPYIEKSSKLAYSEYFICASISVILTSVDLFCYLLLLFVAKEYIGFVIVSIIGACFICVLVFYIIPIFKNGRYIKNFGKRLMEASCKYLCDLSNKLYADKAKELGIIDEVLYKKVLEIIAKSENNFC